MKECLKFFIKISITLLLTFFSATTAHGETLPDFNLSDDNYSLPENVTDMLYENGITPDSVDTDVLSLENVINLLITEVVKYIESPVKLLLTLIAVILMCSLSKVLADTAGNKVKTVFSLICVIVGSAIITVCVSEVITYANTTLKSGEVFLSSFIPAFAGLVSSSGKITSAVVFNSLIMAATQLYIQLAVNILMPVSMCVLALTLSGNADSELNLQSIADNIKKVVIWLLGILMTVFVALLTIQGFIAVGADSVGLKAAKFTVSNAVPFVGGAISDSLAVMQGGMKMIRNNFGVFGIIAGILVMLPSIITAFLYKMSLTLSAALSDLFSLGALSSVIKSAEGIISMILAILACFVLMVVISVSLMIFVAGGTI